MLLKVNNPGDCDPAPPPCWPDKGLALPWAAGGGWEEAWDRAPGHLLGSLISACSLNASLGVLAS